MRWIERRRARRLHGAGWRPDAPDSRDYDFACLGVLDARRNWATLRENCPPVYDQGGTNSCVAQAFAAGIEIRESIACLMPLAPSRLFMYWQARRTHGAGLRDQGTYLRAAAKMLNRVGVPDEEYWPWSTASHRVNRRPSWQAHMRAHPRIGGRYVRILAPAGEERLASIRAALESGHPVAFGTNVDAAFMHNYGDTIITRPLDPSKAIGGHAMLIVGYQRHDDWGYIFDVRNSWGERWRNNGYAWLTEDYINDSASRDFQIIDGWTRIQGATYA